MHLNLGFSELVLEIHPSLLSKDVPILTFILLSYHFSSCHKQGNLLEIGADVLITITVLKEASIKKNVNTKCWRFEVFFTMYYNMIIMIVCFYDNFFNSFSFVWNFLNLCRFLNFVVHHSSLSSLDNFTPSNFTQVWEIESKVWVLLSQPEQLMRYFYWKKRGRNRSKSLSRTIC